MSKRWGIGTMLIPAPSEVDEMMRLVRKGQIITIDLIRQRLAEKHQTDVTCPITTGIFARIGAHAADKAEQDGHRRITPCWRTLKSGYELNPKDPGGIDNLKARLATVGHNIVQRGKRFFLGFT